MRTMTKERKKEGPRLGHKGRADAKASRQLLLLCIPAIIAYILFNYIPMGAAVIIPFKNYKFSKGILGSDWCGLANFKWIIQSVALDRALRNTVLYGLLFMVLSPVTNVIIALLLFEITSRRRLKTYQTIITFPNFMSMVIVGYIVYAILSPRTGLMNQIIQFFGGDPVDVYMNAKYWPFILTVVNIWKGIGMGSMMYFAALMGIDTSLYEAAEIDGAGRFQKMLHISLPHLVPLICIFTIMNAGTLISGNFDLFYVIPRNTSTLYATTDILNTYVYRSLQESSYAIGATTASFSPLWVCSLFCCPTGSSRRSPRTTRCFKRKGESYESENQAQPRQGVQALCVYFLLPDVRLLCSSADRRHFSVIHQRTGPDLRRLFPAAA